MNNRGDYIGEIRYTNESLGEAGGAFIYVCNEGIRISAYTRHDGDSDLVVPIADCEYLITFLCKAIDHLHSIQQEKSNSMSQIDKSMLHIGTINYVNEPLNHTGGVTVNIHTEGIHIGTYSKEDEDEYEGADMTISIPVCAELIELLRKALDQFHEIYETKP